jgi:hypothetical protein
MTCDRRGSPPRIRTASSASFAQGCFGCTPTPCGARCVELSQISVCDRTPGATSKLASLLVAPGVKMSVLIANHLTKAVAYHTKSAFNAAPSVWLRPLSFTEGGTLLDFHHQLVVRYRGCGACPIQQVIPELFVWLCAYYGVFTVLHLQRLDRDDILARLNRDKSNITMVVQSLPMEVFCESSFRTCASCGEGWAIAATTCYAIFQTEVGHVQGSFFLNICAPFSLGCSVIHVGELASHPPRPASLRGAGVPDLVGLCLFACVCHASSCPTGQFTKTCVHFHF